MSTLSCAETVFGCHLAHLCAQENTTVPSFVDKCIRAVEKRGEQLPSKLNEDLLFSLCASKPQLEVAQCLFTGLDIDGLYRVSGNLAVIQKLRFKADHGKTYYAFGDGPPAVFWHLFRVQTEELDLEDGQWEDVHVITGALKLFFRELPDPLFPFSYFNDFVTAISEQTFVWVLNLSSCLLGFDVFVLLFLQDMLITKQNCPISVTWSSHFLLRTTTLWSCFLDICTGLTSIFLLSPSLCSNLNNYTWIKAVLVSSKTHQYPINHTFNEIWLAYYKTSSAFQ